MPILRVRINGKMLDLSRHRIDIECDEQRISFYHPVRKRDRGKAVYDRRPGKVKRYSDNEIKHFIDEHWEILQQIHNEKR